MKSLRPTTKDFPVVTYTLEILFSYNDVILCIKGKNRKPHIVIMETFYTCYVE